MIARACRVALVGAAAYGCGRLAFEGRGDAPLAIRDDAASADGLAAHCMRFPELADDFDDGATAPTWNVRADMGVTTIETGGQLEVRLAHMGSGTRYGGYVSGTTYDLRGRCVSASITALPKLDPSIDTVMLIGVSRDSLGFNAHNGVLDLFVKVNAMYRTAHQVVYDPVRHRILVLREDAGTIYWETSSDGMSFELLYSEPAPFDVSSVPFELTAGTYNPVDTPGTARFDNANVP